MPEQIFDWNFSAEQMVILRLSRYRSLAFICGPAMSKKSIDGKSKSGLHRCMKTRTLALTLAVWVVAGALCFAADPQMGTWKLNEAKSKFAPGTGKNTMVVYKAATGGQVKITADGVDEHGISRHSEWTGKFDGKDYPVTGDPNSDMRSYRKLDDRNMEFTAKKHGKTTVTGRIEVSPDGKSRIVTTSGRTGLGTAASRAVQRGDFLAEAKGQKYNNTAVFEKQ
jgi:hypothetical protein